MSAKTEQEDPSSDGAAHVRRPQWYWVAFHMFFDRLSLLFKFESLRVVHEDRLASIPAEMPLIVYLNHPSWWDPAPVMELKFNAFPGRAAYYPTESKALERASHLKRIGSFPLYAGSVSGTKQLVRDCQFVLSQPGSMLVITPEGKFSDVRKRPLELRRGLASVISKLKTVTVVPLAIEYTLWDESRLEILASWGEPILVEDGTARSTNEWHALLTESLTRTLDELAEISIKRENWRFRPLLHGRLGPRNLRTMAADLQTLYRHRNR